MMLNPSDSRQLPLRTKKPPKSVKQVKDSCKRARPINREQKQIFQEWLTEHSNHLYPNEEDKKELAVKMDANPQQINRLLTKYRQRINQEIQENQLKYKADVAVVKHEKVAINNIISEIVKDVALDNRDQRRIYEERKAKYMLYLKENNMLDEDDDDLQVIWEGKHVATDLNVRNDSNDSPGQQKEVSTTTDNENNNANFKNMENQSNTDQAVSTQPENCDLANKNNIPVERSLQDNTELLPQKDIEVAEVVEIAEVASRDQALGTSETLSNQLDSTSMLFPTAMPQNMPMVQSSSQQQLSNIPATLALLQHHQQLQHQQQLQQQKVANPMQKQPFFNELQHLLQQEVHRQHFQQLLELQQKQQMIAAAVQSSTASTVSGGAIGQMRANLLTPDHLEENKFHGNDTTDSRNHWMSPPVAPLTPASSGSPIQCHIEEAKATSSDRDTGFSDGSSMEAETPPPKVFNSAERLGLGTERLGLGTERLGLGTERLGFGAERLGLTGTDRMNLTNPDVNEKQSFEALKLSETVRTLEALKQSSEALKPSETLKTLESQKQPQKSSEAAELLDLTKAKKSEKKAKKRLATTPRKVSPKKAKVMEMLLNGSRDQLPKKFRDLTESEGIAVAVLAGLAGGR